MKFALCNEMIGQRPLAEVAALASRLGYQGLELAPFTLAADIRDLPLADVRRLRREVEEAGLEVVGLHWLLASPAGLHIAHPDGAVRERTREFFLALIDTCAELGGTLCVLGSPKQRSIEPGWDVRAARRRAAEFLRDVLPHAADRAVTLCLEPLSPDETNFLTTHTEALEFIREVGHPNCRLILDVKAMASERTPCADIIRASAPLLAHVHANDANRRGPGFGETDFVPILKALAKVGYRGYLSVEVFRFDPDPQTIARESLAYLRRSLARATGQSALYAQPILDDNSMGGRENDGERKSRPCG
jgi:sugar phosphate isomerase/epimerase